MLILMHSVDSATGEETSQEVEVAEVSELEIARLVGASFNEEGAEAPEPKEVWRTEYLAELGGVMELEKIWGFAVRGTNVSYHARVLVTGIIYSKRA